MSPDRKKLITRSQFGRTCPFETPEGMNIGRVLHVAVGAEIKDGRLVIVDDRREAALGLTASMVPFLEHNDPNRQLMGVNMMRQWIVPPEPEPAIVQSGHEPNVPGFWCGRNLLTAFIFWGPGTYEDGIIASESCARRLNYPHPLGVGDKLSNRHGTKGTVSAILPDDDMPHLADGTPVELVFSFIGCHTRLNFGQIREGVMSRIARAEGAPAIVPAYCAPGESELRERLSKAGLPETGMETLSFGRGGRTLARPSTVGWIYWGKTHHLAKDKIHASAGGPGANMQAELEYYGLRDIDALETITETFNTRSVDREDAETLADRVAAGCVHQAGPPTPAFKELSHRLEIAGIRAELKDEKLLLRFGRPGRPTLKLARAVPHPWLGDHEVSEVGVLESLAEYRSLVEANTRAERIFASDAPAGLTEKAAAQLSRTVTAFFDALVEREHLHFKTGVLFSGRTVLSPALDLRLDQLGLAQEIAWVIFGPLVAREFGGADEVTARSARAAEALDEIMARSWIILHRAPTIWPRSFIAFHPVRIKENVIRLHPLATKMLNADFDGDQAAVFLPITDAGQREAGELLSVAGHLRHDSGLIRWLIPTHEILWGLASLSVTPEGREEVINIAGAAAIGAEGLLTRASLGDAMERILQRDGVGKALDVLERLMRRGFQVAKESGASMSPFIGTSVKRPHQPTSDDVESWTRYCEEVAEGVASASGFWDNDIGPQVLAVKSGARGTLRHLRCLLGSRPAFGPDGDLLDNEGNPIIIRNGFRDGLTSAELVDCTVGAREGLGQTALECARRGYSIREAEAPKGFNVLARAMRAQRPGVVFANAAATGEGDPLTDIDARLFVGLPPHRRE